MKKLVLISLILMLIFNFNQSYGEEILIAASKFTDEIIFDGDWTFTKEWKPASETIISFENGHRLAIKTAHDYDNIYVLIDFISDRHVERFGDRGIVCIDSKLNRGEVMEKDDYCFMVALGSDKPTTHQGGSLLATQGFLKRVENHPDLIAIGGISSEHDRYSKVPHSLYEFKIPIEIFERSDVYGFYVGAFDSKTGVVYSWPKDATNEKYPFIPFPKVWGKLISPDKSIPEFELPFLILIPAFAVIILLTKLRKNATA